MTQVHKSGRLNLKAHVDLENIVDTEKWKIEMENQTLNVKLLPLL